MMSFWGKDQKAQAKALERRRFQGTDLPVVHVKTAPWFEPDYSKHRHGTVSAIHVQECIAKPGKPFTVTVKLPSGEPSETFTDVDAFLEKWIGD